MDAAALLKSQGWRGMGHSLHPSDDSIGLARPVLFSQKQNVLGLGTTMHRTSDMWWMNAFDQQLKGMENKDDGPGLVQTLKGGELNKIQGRHTKYGIIGGGGLYTNFVPGGLLQGTIDTEESSSSESEEDETGNTTPTSEEPDSAPDCKKVDVKIKETKEERLARRETKRQRKADRAAKRARKAEKRTAKAARRDAARDSKRKEKSRREEKRKSKAAKEDRRKRKLEKRLGKDKMAAGTTRI